MRCLPPVCAEHNTSNARMEHCFMVATRLFSGLAKQIFNGSASSFLYLFS